MKTNLTPSAGTASRESASAPSTKLLSLLALASGAAAMPQNTLADIIYTDLSSNPVMVNYGGEYLFSNLPGTVQFGFRGLEFYSETATYGVSTIYYRLVLAGDLGTGTQAAGGIRGADSAVVPLPFGATWDQGLAAPYFNIPAGIVNDLGARNPLNDYANQYLAWYFADSTQGGAIRYGWIEASLTIGGFNAGPLVTIFGYAYDNTGAKPTMGAVPEPSSAALFALGAMALGARGLRKWRQNRQPVNPT